MVRVLMQHERVDNGVDWLNEHGPSEWWDRIEQPINILDGSVCVLGQVFAAKADETGFLDGYMYVLRTFEEIAWNPSHFGFCDNGDEDAWRLELAWNNAIDKIRTEVAA
jgi:hypothetical protein